MQRLVRAAAFAVSALVECTTWASAASAQAIGTSGSSVYPPLFAEPPQTDARRHDGLYFRYAAGPASLAVSGSYAAGAFAGTSLALADLIALGGTPARGLVVAGALSTYLGVQQVGIQRPPLALGNYGVLVDWFPDERGGWHVGGLAGLGFAEWGKARGYTVGASILGGYDVWVTDQWSIGAMLDASAAPTMQGGQPPDAAALAPFALAIEATVLCH